MAGGVIGGFRDAGATATVDTPGEPSNGDTVRAVLPRAPGRGHVAVFSARTGLMGWKPPFLFTAPKEGGE